MDSRYSGGNKKAAQSPSLRGSDVLGCFQWDTKRQEECEGWEKRSAWQIKRIWSEATKGMVSVTNAGAKRQIIL